MKEAFPRSLLPSADKTIWAPPLEVEDLVVRLEAEGVTSAVAREEYGFPNVWKMAETYLAVLMSRPAVNSQQEPKTSRWKEYLKGMAFATPLLVCCVTVLAFKVGLWGGPLTESQAVAIAIASIAAFVASGGFLQIIARQGYFYKYGKQWALCSRSCWTGVFLAIGCLVMLILIALPANTYFHWLPLDLFMWCAAFTLLIAGYLLVSGVLYVLDAEWIIVLGTVLGAATGGVLFLEQRLPVLISQIIGLSVAVSALAILAEFRFMRLGARAPLEVPLPPIGRLVYMLWPYFVYGSLYYTFLFADRLIAWTAHTQHSVLPLQFRGEYETALDVCLFAFVLQVSWIHAGLARFYRIVDCEQRRTLIGNNRRLRRALLRFYGKQAGILAALFVFSTSAVVWAIHSIPALRAILLFRVALLGLAGIPFVAAGLWNVALLFALSRPLLAVTASGWALVVNVITGYILSRLLSYDYAVLGFDAGACTLAFLTAWSCRRLLANFDYHFFAAAS
jgi:hypothetical protein